MKHGIHEYICLGYRCPIFFSTQASHDGHMRKKKELRVEEIDFFRRVFTLQGILQGLLGQGPGARAKSGQPKQAKSKYYYPHKTGRIWPSESMNGNSRLLVTGWTD